MSIDFSPLPPAVPSPPPNSPPHLTPPHPTPPHQTKPNKRGPVRLHWGKAGWPDPGCWRGDEVFGDGWCSFGCALTALDPSGGAKFADSSVGFWNWDGVDLGRCCGPDGFDSAKEGCLCRGAVRHLRRKEDCPPAPFYSSSR